MYKSFCFFAFPSYFYNNEGLIRLNQSIMIKQKHIFLSLFLLSFSILFAQRPMEKLDRSVIAQKVSGGYFVNWRITADEYQNAAYKLYRNGTLIHETSVTEASNFMDANGTTSSVYTVTKVVDGIESEASKPAIMVNYGYIEIPLRNLRSKGLYNYLPNDAITADLDGDGQMEIILKRLNKDYAASNTHYTFFEAYKLDGTFLWAIDVGPNIVDDVNTSIGAFDFDGDGAAEVFIRSSEGTVFGDGKSIPDLEDAMGNPTPDGIINYRYAIVTQYMTEGPEFLSLVDGKTGAELDRVDWIKRGNACDWGDCYGHRCSKYFFGAPYLDGKHPSIFIGRGIYTQIKMQTYDVVNKKLVKKWYWESLSDAAKQQGKWDTRAKSYFGQGYHNYTIADVDGDGRDEINWGSMAIDDDGKPLYSAELYHGDAQHYGDLDPYRPGQEMFACNETKPGTNMRDAKTGEILYRHITASDCGRGVAANITDKYPGAEMWGGGVGASCTSRASMNHFGVSENFAIYWDGDLCQELLDHSGFSTNSGVGYGKIDKFIDYGNIQRLLSTSDYSCNWSKGTPCLQADLVGDWREEAIWWKTDSMALRIYTTPYPTENRIYTLLHDPQYRQAICWQMCEYNQPPHTGFYLGSDFPTPLPPKSTNGKWIFNGSSNELSGSNWEDGSDAVALYAGNAQPQPYQDGKDLLIDTHTDLHSISLSANMAPKSLTIAGSQNFSIAGNGKFTGGMHIDKMGDSTLVMNGIHDFSGKTEVWEGNLWLNGSFTNSPVSIRRHANFGGKAMLGSGIKTEFNSGLFVGGYQKMDTLEVNGNVLISKGARLEVDIPADSTLIKELLIVHGSLQMTDKSVLNIHRLAESMAPGRYLIAKVDSFIGNTEMIKITGATGAATSMKYEAGKLFLVIKGVRSAGSIEWIGDKGSSWDLAKTTNWKNGETEEIFVTNDSVVFNDKAINTTISLTESVSPASITFDSENNFILTGEGSISGTTGLYKTNSGSLTINNRNAFTGKVIVDEGKLITKYAPSATALGGIGANTNSVQYLVLRDSATLSVLTDNEMTDRGLTLEGSGGGYLENTNTLYWNGPITGTKLTKMGPGTLYLGYGNSGLNETVMWGGKIHLNTSAAVVNGIGKNITIYGGTLSTLNSTGAYLNSSNNFTVPVGYTATVIAGARCEYNGKLLGGGTLNWTVDFIRAYINGDWSAFTGKINLNKNGANSTYNDEFIINNLTGFPYATVNVNSGISVVRKGYTAGTVKMGMLTGVDGAILSNINLEVGTNNSNGTYSGIITGTGSVKKFGEGLWIIKGANTYTGGTTLYGGSISLTGTLGTGLLTLENGTSFTLTGSIGGSALVKSGSTYALNGNMAGSLSSSGLVYGRGTVSGSALLTDSSELQPGATGISTMSFGSNLTITDQASIKMQVKPGVTDYCDKLQITGKFSINGGILKLSGLSGNFAEGDSYKLFNAASISGEFNSIDVPYINDTLNWNLSKLYTEGVIYVHRVATGTENLNGNQGIQLLQNPSNGLFRLDMGMVHGEYRAQVFSMDGKQILDQKLEGGQVNQVDIRGAAQGNYLLQMGEGSTQERFKLIVN